jgi:hypothetical protein
MQRIQNRTFIRRWLTFLILIGGGIGLSCDPIAHYAYFSSAPIPYCELERNAAKYDCARVRINAMLYSQSDGLLMVAWPGCVVADKDFPATRVTINPALNSSPKIQDWLCELQTFSSEIPVKKAEVIITGRFSADVTSGCWGPRHRLSEAAIEQVSPITIGM